MESKMIVDLDYPLLLDEREGLDYEGPPNESDVYFLESFISGGQFEFDPNKIALHRCEASLTWEELLTELVRRGVKPINANLLEFFIDHPDRIPADWRGKRASFLGTKSSCQLCPDPCFYCLAWDGEDPYWCSNYIHWRPFSEEEYVAVFAD